MQASACVCIAGGPPQRHTRQRARQQGAWSPALTPAAIRASRWPSLGWHGGGCTCTTCAVVDRGRCKGGGRRPSATPGRSRPPPRARQAAPVQRPSGWYARSGGATAVSDAGRALHAREERKSGQASARQGWHPLLGLLRFLMVTWTMPHAPGRCRQSLLRGPQAPPTLERMGWQEMIVDGLDEVCELLTSAMEPTALQVILPDWVAPRKGERRTPPSNARRAPKACVQLCAAQWGPADEVWTRPSPAPPMPPQHSPRSFWMCTSNAALISCCAQHGAQAVSIPHSAALRELCENAAVIELRYPVPAVHVLIQLLAGGEMSFYRYR